MTEEDFLSILHAVSLHCDILQQPGSQKHQPSMLGRDWYGPDWLPRPGGTCLARNHVAGVALRSYKKTN